MTEQDLDELERAAQAASAGDGYIEGMGPVFDFAFEATPATVLELIQRLRDAESELAGAIDRAGGY